MKSSYLKFLMFVWIIGSASISIADIDGIWQNKKYHFKIWSFDVNGTWGETKYEVNFWSRDLDGTIGQENFDINFWSNDIDGFLPCGKFDINIWSSNVDGHICGQTLKVDTKSQKESVEVAFDLAINALLDYFPAPARPSLRLEINQRREKNNWMK